MSSSQLTHIFQRDGSTTNQSFSPTLFFALTPIFFPQVDAPRDPTLSVGEMLKRLQEHVLSPVGEVVLAIEATETREPWRFDRGFGKSDGSKKVITVIKHTKNNIVISMKQSKINSTWLLFDWEYMGYINCLWLLIVLFIIFMIATTTTTTTTMMMMMVTTIFGSAITWDKTWDNLLW